MDDKTKFGLYSDLLYEYAYITFCLPYVLAMTYFYSWYSLKFFSFPPRLRSNRLVKIQTKLLQRIGLTIIFLSNGLILAFGKFENEFLRVSLNIAAGLFLYYSSTHYVIRLIVSAILPPHIV